MRYEDYIARNAPGKPVVFLRLYLAGYFIYRAATFFTSGMVGSEFFDARLQQLLDYRQLPVIGSYFKLLGGIPAEVLASAILATCLIVGMSMLLGLHTRLFGSLGLVFLVHGYLLGYLGPSADQQALIAEHTLALRLHESLIVGMVVVMWASAGHAWGVDGLVWRRRLKREFAYPENPKLDPVQAVEKNEDDDDVLPAEPVENK